MSSGQLVAVNLVTNRGGVSTASHSVVIKTSRLNSQQKRYQIG